jgi:hypothetical protein
MNLPSKPSLTLLYNEARLTQLSDALDALHSAAADGTLRTVSTVSNAELIAWLHEIIYVAQETIAEIREQQDEGAEGLHLVRRTS